MGLPKIGGTLGQLQKKTNISHVGKGITTAAFGGPTGGNERYPGYTEVDSNEIPYQDNETGETVYGTQAEVQSAAHHADQERKNERQAIYTSQIEQMVQARDRQKAYGEELKLKAMGKFGVSAAESQLQMATDKNMRGALAMAASGRGNAALANQAAGAQRAEMGQVAAAQATSLRAQEQQQAQAQYAALVSDMRHQELGIESAMARREGQILGVESQEAALSAQASQQASAQAAAEKNAWRSAAADFGTAYVTSGGSEAAKATQTPAPSPAPGAPQYALTGGQPATSLTGAPPQGTPQQFQAMQGFAPPQGGGFGGMGGGFAPPQGGQFQGGGFTGSPEQMAYQGPQDDQARRHQQMMAMVNAQRMGRF